MSFKKLIYILLGVMLLVLAGCGGNEKKQAAVENAYMELTDAAGRHVVIAKKPERVVSLTPSYLA